jgi:TFIIF-interacting CTD phosphatase-like protein
MKDVCTTLSLGELHSSFSICGLISARPGWKEFLEDVANKYEMHVYTMGTRAYAEQVCAAIDPDGKLFVGRLLSRDESGSKHRFHPLLSHFLT